MGLGNQSQKLNLYLRHRTELIDYATPLVGDRALAEDVVQDAWVRFADSRPHDAGARLIQRPLGYLYRIVRNLAVDLARRQKVVNWTDDGAVAEIADAAVPVDQAIEGREKLKALHRALAELPDRERMAFHMHRMEGLTYTQIGAALKISQSRAHELVRDALGHCMTRLMDEGHL